jgi:hypothetical protein
MGLLMTLSKYIVSMAIIALFCWLIWVVVLFQIDPYKSGFLGFIFFYLTLFFALTATFSVLGLVVRRWLLSVHPPVEQVSKALRQGIWFGLLLTGSLILSSFNLLNWWNGALLIAILAVLEFFFLSKNRSVDQDS